MSVFDRARLLSFHRRLIAEHGVNSSLALAWNSNENQELRFEKLLGTCDFSNCSVLDIGCGRGDLKSYLDARFTNVEYIGIDLMPEFLDEAQKRFGKEGTWLFGDAGVGELPEVDYVLASGAFNYKLDHPTDFFHRLSRLWKLSRKGMAFNLLGKVYNRASILQDYDPKKIEIFCKELSPKVKIIEGYLDSDYSVWIRR